jgi:pyruvate/2-oxoglutarate dehydrogenase complex dihydrolipoamide dehydrogenase (E3) component
MKKVKERKDALVDKSNSGVEKWMKNTENLTVFEGHARFTDNRAVQVNDELLRADKIFINTGGRPRIPTGYDGIDFLTSDTILDLEKVPGHLLIVGGGYIGLEFGQMFRRFGSMVTIIEKSDRLIKREDKDVSEAVQDILRQEDIELRLNAECLSGKMENDKVVVNLDCNKGEKLVKGSHLLLAVGRVPNTDDLGLEHTDIKVNDRGFIGTDDTLKTSVSGIWALGDCNGRGAFTHTAYNDFEIAAANLFDNDPRSTDDRIPCYALYIDPALARIGMTEEHARKSGKKVLMATRSMEKISRAKEKGETDGFMKILVDAESEKILGASILGIEGDEIIHSLLDVMYANASYKTISRAVHIHPTVSELIPTTLHDLKPLDRCRTN